MTVKYRRKYDWLSIDCADPAFGMFDNAGNLNLALSRIHKDPVRLNNMKLIEYKEAKKLAKKESSKIIDNFIIFVRVYRDEVVINFEEDYG